MNIPVYAIHDRAIELVAQIAEKVGALKAASLDFPNLHLRKASRIRSIHSSLAIEQNTLSLEQVTGEIVGFLAKNGSISNAQAVSVSGRGTVSVKKYLQRLTDKGFLKAEGVNKGRRYFIATR